MNFDEGEIFYIDKPLHWTSFDAVKRIRMRILRRLHRKKIKVGHAGTLDPLATGVMLICTGKATKRIESLQYQTKEYVATIQLGATTPSFDLETEIDARYPYEHITRETVETVLPRFMGSIMQVPPAYSACKVDGKRAYEMARKGQEVELKAKELVIDEIELLEYALPVIRIRVVCGQALGSGAHLTALQRTRIGDVRLSDCISVDDVIHLIETAEVEETLSDGSTEKK